LATKYNSLLDLKAGEGEFGSPFDDFSSSYIPNELDDVFKLSEEMWIRMGMWRQGLQRIIKYFITELEFTGETMDYQEEKEWKRLCNKVLQIPKILGNIGEDFLVYGNSINSIHVPFIRHLKCPKCHLEVPAKFVDYTYRDGKFYWKCKGRLTNGQSCDYDGEFIRIDRKDPSPDKIHNIRWSVHEIDLITNPLSGYTEYYWTPPDTIKEKLHGKNSRFYSSRLPYEVIKCAEDSGLKLKLDNSTTYHMKIDTLSGIKMGGWGLPPILSNFSDIWYVQTLRKYNEAIAMDYMVPLRVITPAPMRSSPDEGLDPMYNLESAPGFMSQVLEMISDRRKNPTGWYALPFPVQYGPVGGEGTQMAAPDLEKHAIGTLLNNMGVPLDFFEGTLNMAAAPIALRQLEKTWDFLVLEFNAWVDWFVDNVATITGRERVDASLKPTTIVEDLARKQLLLELAYGGKVSEQTAFDEFNIDVREEAHRIRAEEEFRAKMMREMEENMQQYQMPPIDAPPMGPGAPPAGAGGPPPGAGQAVMPPGPGAVGMTSENQPRTLKELEALAQQEFMRLQGLPDAIRRSELIRLDEQNPALHALVSKQLEQFRQETNLQGGVMLRQQMTGQ
jgi:hypothetical protein